MLGSNALSQWNITGKEVPPDPDFRLAQSWIDDCYQNHASCAQLSYHPLPKRVLDMRPFEDTPDIRLIDGAGNTGKYAALSHCWGNSQPIQLTSKSHKELQIRISFSQLPRTFQDAVTAARALGLRFLWIDSLCIIQDSEADWQEQCARMANIYKNAFVTIAGPTASGCNSGFLHKRPMPRQQVMLQISTGRKVDNVMVSHHGVIDYPSSLIPESNSPLAKRGWILQERLLSQRILYFSSTRMYIECFHNVRSDDCHYTIRWNHHYNDVATKKSIKHLQKSLHCLDYWSEIIQNYANLRLSKPKDRLPALSGLASEIQKATNAQYLAGIWREDISTGLAWFLSRPKEAEQAQTLSNDDYIAPSWSWAAAKHKIEFQISLRRKEVLKVVDCDVPPAGLDPFGMVNRGFIQVKGRIRHAVVRNLPSYMFPATRELYVQSDEPQSRSIAVYVPDDVRSLDLPEFEVLLLYLGSHVRAALSIEKTQSHPDEYRRIGLAYAENVYTWDFELERMFEGLSPDVIRLI